MQDLSWRQMILTPGWMLALIALVGVGILILVQHHSAPYIRDNQEQVRLKALNAVLQGVDYDNAILEEAFTLRDAEYLGSDAPLTAYRARNNGRPVALALTVVAANGYSGPITLLLGVNRQQQVTGVRVVQHKETPGLGDGVEKRRSNWIDGFLGRSRSNTADKEWKVKRDGGRFEQLTGATITPRAIVKAVHQALIYVSLHEDQLFNVAVDPDARNRGQ